MRDHDKTAKELAHRNAVVAYRRELQRQIKMFGEIADRGNGYAREYYDYLVALRDGTLSETEKRAGPGLIFNQDSADHAFKILSRNFIGMRLAALKLITETFSKWGASRETRRYSRYKLLSPISLENALELFDPIRSRAFVFRAAFPLRYFGQYGYVVRIVDLMKEVGIAWETLFETIQTTAKGEEALASTMLTYQKLMDQFMAQCGHGDDSHMPIEERKELLTIFKAQLENLATRVYACDAKRFADGEAATDKRSETFEAKDTDLSTKGQCPLGQKTVTLSKDLKVSPRLLKNFIKKVDFEQQIIEFKKIGLMEHHPRIKIKKTEKNKLWNFLVPLLTQTDDDGWVTLAENKRNWRGLFRRTARGDKKRKIVDPFQDAMLIQFHIASKRKPGRPEIKGEPTKIRLEADYDHTRYDDYSNLFETKRKLQAKKATA